MKIRFVWLILCVVLAFSLVFASCSAEKNTSTATTKSTVITQSTQTSNTTKVTTISSTTTAVQTTTATQAHWWDKYGTPQYGSTITFAPFTFSEYFDATITQYSLFFYFQEPLWFWDWTLDRKAWSFSTPFVPTQYYKGLLVESWEWPDLYTCVAKVRQGIRWQDKAPVNGREFTAYDIQQHYDRFLGTGSGYTTPNAYYAGRMGTLTKVIATDKYTVTFKFSNAAVTNFYTLVEQAGNNYIAPPEISKPGAPLTDWKNAVGTGPWIVSDYTSGSGLTLVKNSNYWSNDERYPQNKIPYADKLVIKWIPDVTTRLAALRSAQVDFASQLSFRDAANLSKSNPEINQAKLPYPGDCLILRVDNKPFNDIRVRRALDLSIDRQKIASTYYAGTVDGIPCGRINPVQKGYCYAYEDWPQSLKDEYTYNPTKAKQLMVEAGYPNGFNTNVVGATSTMDIGLAQILQSYLKETLNVNMEIRTMDTTALRAYMSGRLYDQMNWGQGSIGLVVDPVFAVGFSYSKNQSNYSNVNDPSYDATYLKLQSAATENEYKNLLIELDKRTVEGHWNIATFSSANFNFSQPYLKGYSGESLVRTGDPGSFIWARYWIDKSLKK
jgi:peptide/nickel transport system substrate-binding protein